MADRQRKRRKARWAASLLALWKLQERNVERGVEKRATGRERLRAGGLRDVIGWTSFSPNLRLLLGSVPKTLTVRGIFIGRIGVAAMLPPVLSR